MKFLSLRRLVALAGIVVFFLFAWLVYDIGKLRGAVELESLRAERVQLRARLDAVESERDDLRDTAALHERSSQIDRQAADEVKARLGELEEALKAAHEEITFYKGIVSPGDVRQGLQIHSFRLEPGSVDGEFHYELVLTQLKRNDRYVSGVVKWKVKGALHGEPGELALEGITSPPVKELRFRFRYFQELGGTVKLPEHFEAETVELSVKPSGKNGPAPIVQKYEWLASGETAGQ